MVQTITLGITFKGVCVFFLCFFCFCFFYYLGSGHLICRGWRSRENGGWRFCFFTSKVNIIPKECSQHYQMCSMCITCVHVEHM